MKKPAFIIGFVICIIISLVVVHVTVANSLSTTGLTLSKYQDEINQYKKQNALLEEKILSVSSLTYISQKAQTEGFSQSKSEMLIPAPLPIAYTR